MPDLRSQLPLLARVRNGVLIAVVAGLVAVALAAPAAADVIPAPNSGLPGSTCQPGPVAAPYKAPGAGVTTTGLGSNAPAYYEIGSTTGAFAGKTPKGIMIVIHGGGWYAVGKELLVGIRPYVDHWRARGWQTVSIDYRGCGQSLGDVFWFMQRIRQMRPNATICAAGMSAGGHLALMLASVRKDLACVIAMAGPSDLGALSEQTAYDPTLTAFTPVRPTMLYNVALSAFGGDPATLVFSSPMRYVTNVNARVLLASGELDTIVPTVQNTNYAAALKAAQPNAYVDVALLPFGMQPFVHTGISPAAGDDLNARELALVAPFG